LTIISQSKYDDLSDLRKNEQTFEVVAGLLATIEAVAPPGSAYRTTAEARKDGYNASAYATLKPLKGILQSLREAYEKGYLETVQELIHANLFSDFLEMGEHLLSQGYKDAAAVIIGSVLEEHLRKLAGKNHVPPLLQNGTPKKADTLNGELRAADIYSGLDAKNVTGWLDLRNKAAHGKYAEFDSQQVKIMLAGVKHFVAMHPA